MKNLQTFEEFLNENLNFLNEAEVKVAPKDWDRMMDLVLKGDTDGDKVAKLIKDKNKAMARFVAGLKLDNSPLRYENSRWSPYGYLPFATLGKLALDLGATPEEIQDLYDRTEVPTSTIEKMNKRAGKKLDNRFVGVISKAVIDAGGDIEYLPHNGNAMTREGKDAMSRSGRKWTIGYKTIITINKNKYNFAVDAITDEGDGPTFYILNDFGSSIEFEPLFYKVYGKNEFISKLKEILKSLK